MNIYYNRYGLLVKENENYNILLYNSNPTSDIEIVPFCQREKNYIAIFSTSGSGGYLTVDIYSYSGLDKIRKIYCSESYPCGEYFFDSGYFIIKGVSNRKYVSIFDDKVWTDTYKKHPVVSEYFTVFHTLRIESENQKLNFYFDNKKINFTENNSEVVNLYQGDLVIIDDIDVLPNEIDKYLCNGKMAEINSELFTKLAFNSKGIFTLIVRSSDFYHINFCVK